MTQSNQHISLDLLVIWLFSGMSFITMNNLVGFFAIIASLTTIVKNIYPFIRKKNKLKNGKVD